MTPALMIQGTASHVGKTLLTAGLCRVLLQDGVRVAPFKAQNISLNSFVTAEGQEIARAQAVQAVASRIEPDVRMSPILLKPDAHGCQTILRGRPVTGLLTPEEAFAAAADAYNALAAGFDCILIEGSGSPAEINLRERDIANMRMAHHAQARVLLAGDIERGGVFAALIGTMELLRQSERDRVAGYLINRFRGDSARLREACDFMRERTNRPVLGVIPFMEKLNLPEEDTLSLRHTADQRESRRAPEPEVIDIALIALPHISNFTDLDPLRLEEDVCVRIVEPGEAIGEPDALILPGTKNTLADLATLRSCEMDRQIQRLAASGSCEIIGICGGYQMLGGAIRDPDSVESHQDMAQGLGLLPLETSFAREKILRRIRTRHRVSGHLITGYEIHHGQSVTSGGRPLFTDNPGGLATPDGRVWGCYLHGLFDPDEFRRWFINRLREKRGLPPLAGGAVYSLEPALDRIAKVLRESLRLKEIYELLKL